MVPRKNYFGTFSRTTEQRRNICNTLQSLRQSIESAADEVKKKSRKKLHEKKNFRAR
jgi:hypothetical protein